MGSITRSMPVGSPLAAKEDSCLDQPPLEVKTVRQFSPISSKLTCSAPYTDRYHLDSLSPDLLRTPFDLPEARYENVWLWRFPNPVRNTENGHQQVLPQGSHDTYKYHDYATYKFDWR